MPSGAASPRIGLVFVLTTTLLRRAGATACPSLARRLGAKRGFQMPADRRDQRNVPAAEPAEFVMRHKKNVAARRGQHMTIPEEQHRDRQNGDSVVGFFAHHQVTGRINNRSAFPKRLSKTGKERHMLARRPDVPISKPDEEFWRCINESVQKPCQPYFSARILW